MTELVTHSLGRALRQFFEVFVIIRLDGQSLAAQSKAFLEQTAKKSKPSLSGPLDCFYTDKKASALKDHRHKVPIV